MNREKEVEYIKKVDNACNFIFEDRHKIHGSFFNGDIKEYTHGVALKMYRFLDKDVSKIIQGELSEVNKDTLIDLRNYLTILLARQMRGGQE